MLQCVPLKKRNQNKPNTHKTPKQNPPNQNAQIPPRPPTSTSLKDILVID